MHYRFLEFNSRIFFSSCSIFVHNVRHWLLVNCSFVSILVSSFIWSAFSSKNFVLNFLMFSCGIGFRIFFCLFVVGGGWWASRAFGGCMMDVYKALLGILI